LRSRQGQADAALADYTRLISMRPEEARGFRRRGEILLRAGKPVEALRDLDRAVALGGSEGTGAHYARGMAHAALGDVDAVLAAYDAAIEHEPTHVAARLRRFQIHADRQEWDKCRIDTDAMLARSPDDTSLLLAHARALRRTHAYDDTVAALFAYDRLVALEPGNAVAHKERSEALVGTGDSLAACASMARAFELAPDDPEIRASHGCNQAMRAESDEERAAALALIASSVERDAHDPEAWALAASRLVRGRDAETAQDAEDDATECDTQPDFANGLRPSRFDPDCRRVIVHLEGGGPRDVVSSDRVPRLGRHLCIARGDG
jgi:tetratricopeptide (TPR) repeat protein